MTAWVSRRPCQLRSPWRVIRVPVEPGRGPPPARRRASAVAVAAGPAPRGPRLRSRAELSLGAPPTMRVLASPSQRAQSLGGVPQSRLRGHLVERGGDLALLSADVVTGVVEVQLQGACSSCAVSSSTLQGGVDRILRDRLPWVTEVRGGVDESVDPLVSESMGRGSYVPSF